MNQKNYPLMQLFAGSAGNNSFGAFILIGIAVSMLSLQDALIKFLSLDFSFWQFQFLRSVLNILILVMIAALSGSLRQLIPKKPKYALLRSIFLATTMIFLFGVSPSLNFSQMAAGLYTFPLFVTLMVGPILGEKIGIWRVSAVCVGALGAFILLNPLASGFEYAQILPLIGGFFFACNIMTLRGLCREESVLAMGMMTALVFLFIGILGVVLLAIFPAPVALQQELPFLLQSWLPIGASVLVIVGVSLLNVLGNMFNARAYQSAESSILAPLDFCYLILATFWAFVLFAEVPTPQVMVGMVLIAASGVTITVREHYRKKVAF